MLLLCISVRWLNVVHIAFADIQAVTIALNMLRGILLEWPHNLLTTNLNRAVIKTMIVCGLTSFIWSRLCDGNYTSRGFHFTATHRLYKMYPILIVDCVWEGRWTDYFPNHSLVLSPGFQYWQMVTIPLNPLLSIITRICFLTSMFVWRFAWPAVRSRINHERFDIFSPNFIHMCTLA